MHSILVKVLNMKYSPFLVVLTALLTLCVPKMQAFTHNFQMKNIDPKTISFSASNTVATSTNDNIVYTCTGTAFASYNSVLTIPLLDNGDQVVVSPAIEGLIEVTISYYPSQIYTSIRVDVSQDGSSWTNIPEGSGATYNKGIITVRVPKSAYYVRIRSNNGSNDAYIQQITYTTTDCNCFPYVAE